jgi:HSP20 family protein
MAIYRTWSVQPFGTERPRQEAQPDGVPAESDSRSAGLVRTIPVRIRETENSWFVEADAPGVSSEAIGIEFYQQRLTIRYERKSGEHGTTKYDELAYGLFERVIRIADEVHPDRIAAKYENGVLRLELPKSEALLPRKIRVTGE